MTTATNTSLITCTITEFENNGNADLEAYRGRTLTTEQQIDDFIVTVKAAIADRDGYCLKTWFTLATADGEYSVEMREDVTGDSPFIREALADRLRFWNSPSSKSYAQACKINADEYRDTYAALADALEGDYEPQATDANEEFYTQAYGL